MPATFESASWNARYKDFDFQIGIARQRLDSQAGREALRDAADIPQLLDRRFS